MKLIVISAIMLLGIKVAAYSFTCNPHSTRSDAHYIPDAPECVLPCGPMYHPIRPSERHYAWESAVCFPDCTGRLSRCQKSDGSWQCCSNGGGH